jgi:hypothetical protein
MILDETQIAVRDMVHAFAQEQLRPRTQAFEAAAAIRPNSSRRWRNWA